MASIKETEQKIQNLIGQCNEATGKQSTTLSDGVSDLSAKASNLGQLTVKSNGIYTAAKSGFNGFDKVSVNVPGVTLPALSNAAKNKDVREGKRYIDSDGKVQTGTYTAFAAYAVTTLANGTTGGDLIRLVTFSALEKWKSLFESVGSAQSYVPIMFGVMGESLDVFQGALVSPQQNNVYMYVGHNFMGTSTLQFNYDDDTTTVSDLTLTVNGDVQAIPESGLSISIAWYYPQALS